MPNLKELQTLFWRPENISVAITGTQFALWNTQVPHTSKWGIYLLLPISQAWFFPERREAGKKKKKSLNPKVMGCFSKCHSLPEQGWVMTSGDVTAQNSISKILFPAPKLILASQWEMQQSSEGFQTCPALQAPKLCIYNINCSSFPCLVTRFARILSAHLRHQKTLKSKGIDFVTEGEVDSGLGSRSRTWA